MMVNDKFLVGCRITIYTYQYIYPWYPMVESFMAHRHLPRSISEHFSWRKVLFWRLKQMAPWKWDAKQHSNKNQGSYSTCWGTHWKLAKNLNEFPSATRHTGSGTSGTSPSWKNDKNRRVPINWWPYPQVPFWTTCWGARGTPETPNGILVLACVL